MLQTLSGHSRSKRGWALAHVAFRGEKWYRATPLRAVGVQSHGGHLPAFLSVVVGWRKAAVTLRTLSGHLLSRQRRALATLHLPIY